MGVILSCTINKDATKELTINRSIIEEENVESKDNLEKTSELDSNFKSSTIEPPTLILRTNLSKNNSELLSTGCNQSDPEWDVHFTNIGLVYVTAIFAETIQNPFTVIVKVCGHKLTIDCDQEKTKRMIQPMGSIAIVDVGTRTITARLVGTETHYLKSIVLSGSGVNGARNLSPGAHRIVAYWSFINQCDYFYSRIKVIEANSDTVFGICWFYFVQFGLCDSSGQRSILLNVSQTKPVSHDIKFEMIEMHEEAITSQISSEDALIHQYSIPYAWELNVSYHALIHHKISNKNQKYIIYFRVKGKQSWEKIAILQFSNDGIYHNPIFASFIEEKIKYENAATALRKARFGPCWYGNANNEWKQVDHVRIQDADIQPSARANSNENNIYLVMDESTNNKNIDYDFSLTVKNKLPKVLETLPLSD